MKKEYAKTKNKIKKLWESIEELTGILEKKDEEILSLQKSLAKLWAEFNRQKTELNVDHNINVNKCYLKEIESDGTIILDDNGNEKISPLLPEVVWDEDTKSWKFYAVYH